MTKNILTQLNRKLYPEGLTIRGGFHFTEEDVQYTLYLIGHGGSSFWPVFSKSEFIDTSNDALDNWTKQVVGSVAKEFNAEAFYPSDGPRYKPFQQWAIKAENLRQSPLGMLIHPEYGLWHAYRAAIMFEGSLHLPKPILEGNICESCVEKPCLTTCPVNAFSDEGYDVPTCIKYLKTPAGSDCMDKGCMARRGCPVGQDYIYDPDQAAFHMRAFKDAH